MKYLFAEGIQSHKREVLLVQICIRFIFIFLFFELTSIYFLGQFLHTHLQYWLANISTQWLYLLGSDEGSIVIAGNQIIAGKTAATIDNSCDALHMIFSFSSLMLAIPKAFSRRILAIIIGTICLFLYNSIRIAHLFTLLQNETIYFQLYHQYLWQFINLVFLYVLVYLCWMTCLRQAKDIQSSLLHQLKEPLTVLLFVIIASTTFAFGGGGGPGPAPGSTGVAMISLEGASLFIVAAVLLLTWDYWFRPQYYPDNHHQ